MNEFYKEVTIVAAFATPFKGQDGQTKERHNVELLVDGRGCFRCSTYDDKYAQFVEKVGQRATVKVRVRAYKDSLYYTALEVIN